MTQLIKFDGRVNNRKIPNKDEPEFTKIHPFYVLTNKDGSIENFSTLKEIMDVKGQFLTNLFHLCKKKCVKGIDFTLDKCECPYEYKYKGIIYDAKNLREIGKKTDFSCSKIHTLALKFINK